MNKKMTGIVSYLTLIGWLVAYFAGDREGAKRDLNQALVLAVAGVALSIVSRVLGWIPLVGWLISVVCGLAGVAVFLLAVLGIVNVLQDKDVPLPLVGGIEVLK